MHKRIVLKDAGVLLIAAIMVLSTVMIVAGSTIKNSEATDSSGYSGMESIEGSEIFSQLFDKGIQSNSAINYNTISNNNGKKGEINILNNGVDWQWAKGAGGTSGDVGRGIVTLSDESIIVTGSFSGSATFGKGESAETVLVSDGSDDIFLAKHNPDGTIAWAKRAGGTDYDFGNGVSVDGNGNTYITGSFKGIADFGPYTLTSQRDSDDVFVAKLSDGGNQPPNTPSTPSGSTSGKTGTSYTYSSSTTDPNGDKISYMFDWGDGQTSAWTDPVNSGQLGSASHTWTTKGTYPIKVKARDIPSFGESEWSDPLIVSMPRSRAINTPFLNFLEQYPILYQLLQQFLQS